MAARREVKTTKADQPAQAEKAAEPMHHMQSVQSDLFAVPAGATDVAAAMNHPKIEIATRQHLEVAVVDVMRTVYDPEIPVNVYDLGLVYDVNVDDTAFVHVKMTLTAPACPVAGTLPPEVEQKIRGVSGVRDAKVEVVWEPPWTPERMTEAAKLQLGFS